MEDGRNHSAILLFFRMKNVQLIRRFAKLALVLWAVLLPTAVFAHDGSARVVLNLYEIAPGQPLEVSGINLGTDLQVQVSLVGSETAVPLGSALCDGHGDFIQQFTLPADLPNGVYTIQALDTSIAGLTMVLAEAQFRVDETAVSQPVNSPQIVTFTSPQYRWQQPLYAALAGLALLLFLLPSMLKWWRSKKAVPHPSQSQIQK